MKLATIFDKLSHLDPKSKGLLTKALVKNNQLGFDYLEFKLSLNGLNEIGLDDEIAIKSAYTTASMGGLTKKKLLDSANHYKTVLVNEQALFEKAVQNQMAIKVEDKKQELSKLEKDIELWKNEIKKLQLMIDKTQKILDNADENIEKEKTKIINTKTNFEATFKAILEHINGDIRMIEKVL